jgi:DNA-binding GntR family transcriptional regulator
MVKRRARALTNSNDFGSSSRGEYVQSQIREAIRAGKYEPGERIREAEMAKRLGVSRTPVREALRRLESEGLVAFVPWRGVVVAELGLEEIIQLYAMREILEGTAARFAAQHISDSEIAIFEEILEKERLAAENSSALADINRTFHQLLYDTAHNAYLMQSLNVLRNSLALLRGTTFSAPGRPVIALEEHKAIVDAIKSRDGDAAEKAARHHIRESEKTRLKMLYNIVAPRSKQDDI